MLGLKISNGIDLISNGIDFPFKCVAIYFTLKMRTRQKTRPLLIQGRHDRWATGSFPPEGGGFVVKCGYNDSKMHC